MNKNLLILVSLIAAQAMAMEPIELTIDQQALPIDTTEEKVVIIIEEEIELPARYISLFDTLKNLRADLPESKEEGIPLRVSHKTWHLIETQLERIYKSINGDNDSRDGILADCTQLDSRRLIDLIRAVEYLNIPHPMNNDLELVQNKLTLDEILELPAYIRNEVIKRKAYKIAGPTCAKQVRVLGSFWATSLRPRLPRILRLWLLRILRWGDIPTIVCVTPDNKIVSGSYDGTVRIWNIDGKELAVFKVPSPVVCITHDNKIVSGYLDRTVRIWDMAGKELAVCEGHAGQIKSVCVTLDGSKIVSGYHDGTMRIWAMNGQELAVCRHEDWVFSVCVTSDHKIISSSRDLTVRIWGMDGTQHALFRPEIYAMSMVAHDNKIVLDLGRKVGVWDMSCKQLAVCEGHKDSINSVCVTSDHKIISSSRDETVRIWDMDGKELAVCEGHGGAVRSISVTSDGKIVSVSTDGIVRIWDSNLLDRFSDMNTEQAQAICKVLQLAPSSLKEQEQCWKEIWNVFEEKGSNLSKWCSSEAIKVMLIVSVSLLVARLFLDLEIMNKR